MTAMRVLRLVVHALSRQPMLLLGEVDGTRCLPVFLRRPQAEVIAVGPRGAGGPPLTQDLVGTVAVALGRRLCGVELTGLTDGRFAAELVLDADQRIVALPSDALALAVRDGLPISVAEEILDRVGQPIAELFPNGADAAPADQLREFREFIDQVSPEDFRPPPERP